jgi:outer membrane lipoprotein-sorting protein
MRACAAWILFLLAMALPIAAPADDAASGEWGLNALMADLSRVQSVSARFVEDKYLASLTRPLHSAGTLRYVAPNRIERTTTEPPGEKIVVEGETLTTSSADGQTVTVALDEHPEIAALVEGFRSTLAGDLATLRRYYGIDFAGGRADWRLTLKPRNPAVRQRVDLIRLSGSGTAVGMVEVQEKDGDHSVMIVTPDAP